MNTNNVNTLCAFVTIFAFVSGGIILVFSGESLDSAPSPLLEITDSHFSQAPPVVSFFYFVVSFWVSYSFLLRMFSNSLFLGL